MLELFAGIGGWSVAAEPLGWKTVGQVEIDSFCQEVLHANWPDVPLVADIKDVTGNEFSNIDIIVGSPPCQAVSTAGERKGTNDERWLWPETFRVIKSIRPRWVVLENVAGIITMDIDALLVELEEEGYNVWTFVIPATAVSAPHIRKRVWIVGHRKDADGITRSRATSEVTIRRGGEYIGLDVVRSTGYIEAVPDAASKRSSGQRESQQPKHPTSSSYRKAIELVHDDQPYVRAGESNLDEQTDGLFGKPLSRLAIDEVRQAWYDGSWETGIDRTSAHNPRIKEALKTLGNAIVPQVAYEILYAIEVQDRANGRT